MRNYRTFYKGDGATVQYDITFPFLRRTHVHAYVDEVEVAFDWLNDGRISLDVAPKANQTIQIVRETPTQRIHEIQNNRPTPAEHYTDLTQQALYKTEEMETDLVVKAAEDAAASAKVSEQNSKVSEQNSKVSEQNSKVSEQAALAAQIKTESFANLTGFLQTAIYDPEGVEEDVFSADNHKDGTTKVVMLATERKAIKQNTDDITTLKNADKSVDQNVWNTGTSEIEAVISPVKLTNKIKDMFSGGGASGWTKLPNGLIVQSGGAPANTSGSTTITFPVKFPTKLISFTAAALVDNDTAVSIGYTNVTTYSVLAKPRFSSNSIATEGFTYIAIGY